MRSRTMLKNVSVLIVVQLLNIVYSLFLKKAILTNLPLELIGYSSLFDTFFTSILYIDVGFSALMSYSLFHTVNKNKDEETLRYISLYRTIFSLIATFIIILGVIMYPILGSCFDVSKEFLFEVNVLFGLQIFSIAGRYYLMHKLLILDIYQKNYLSGYVSIVVDFATFLFKSIAVIYYKNFIIYSAIIFLSPFINHTINRLMLHKLYPQYKKVRFSSLKDVYKSGILHEALKYMPRSFYGVIYYSMDNLIISKLFNVLIIAYLSNYTMLYNVVGNFTQLIVINMRSTIANFMIVEENKDGDYFVFETLNVLNILIVSVVVSGFILLSNSFIEMMFGSKFLIETSTMVLLVVILGVNTFFRFYENTFILNGLLFKEKGPLIISAILNLVLSVCLGIIIGVNGIFLGTLISTIALWIGRTRNIYKDIYNDQGINFYRNLSSHIIKITIISTCVIYIYNILQISSFSIFSFIKAGLFICLLNLMFYVLVNIKNIYFKYLYTSIKALIVK